MCISALIETGGNDPEVAKSLDRGEAWLFDHLRIVRRATPDVFYNTWTHTYAIQALTHMLQRKTGDKERQRRIRDLIEHQIGMLDRYEVRRRRLGLL